MYIPSPNSRYPIEPIHDRPDDSEQRRRRQLSTYKGRQWKTRKDKTLPIKPKFNPLIQQQQPIVIDKVALNKARALFNNLTTHEEKIAQLCLYLTDAIYNADEQMLTEQFIMSWQIGGLVFQSGDFRRQNYLIERYQEVSKTPLLIGNQFRHALSFYDPENAHLLACHDEQLTDIGKAVMGLNKSLHVHFQYDRDETLTDEQARAFRRGIRRAKGIVASSNIEKNLLPLKQKNKPMQSSTILELQQSREQATGEIASIKTLHICDLTQEEITEKSLLAALRNNYACFLCDNQTIRTVITMLTTALSIGHLTEAELDRCVMRLLYLKALNTTSS